MELERVHGAVQRLHLARVHLVLQDGLRDGNLKELFEDEIRKSWEEYAEQVGKDVAESTPYFKEALNEILAGGRQIF